MPRLFLAVWPPDDVVSELMSLRRKDQRGVRFVEPQNWHVTLRFLGDASIDDVEDAVAEIDLPSTTATLGPAVDVLGERVLAVPVNGLEELADVLTDATRGIGEPPPNRPFRGHLTIARITRTGRTDHGVRMPPALGSMVDGEFDVCEVALVRSRLDPDGARYDTVTSWPVGSTDPLRRSVPET